MLSKFTACILLAFIFYHNCAWGQTPDSAINPQHLPAGFFSGTGEKVTALDHQLSRQSEQYLNRLSAIESKLFRKMHKVDTAAASRMTASNYQQWIDRLHDSAVGKSGAPGTYSPRLDTLQTTLHFLQNQQGASGAPATVNPQLAQATAGIQQLQAHLDESTLINQYIADRKQAIAQYLAQFTHLPPGVAQTFTQFKTTSYYYRQQVEEFKNSLNDPQKIEEKAIRQLSKLPAYQQFLAQHSMLASLFQLPAGYGDNPSLQGLQTHDQVQQIIQQQVSAGGASGQAAVDQQMQQAQSQLSNMQNNLAKYGAAGQNLDMPNFTPDQQKTKTFLKRLSYGASIQLSKSSNYFPATGNIGLSLGYKINDKSTAGVGASYIMGLGRDWGHMALSNQGLGFRSYMDWKIKKTYYVTGGYELNYMSQFSNIAQLRNLNFWQPSALIGLEKKYKISSKLQGNLQLLFDALYRQEVPAGQMFKFRVGYGF
jgi:hypothetical protein